MIGIVSTSTLARAKKKAGTETDFQGFGGEFALAYYWMGSRVKRRLFANQSRDPVSELVVVSGRLYHRRVS